VLSLIDFKILSRAWDYSKADFAAIVSTIVLTLGVGVEAGVTAGVTTSILLFLYKTSRPNVAEVGLVPDTQHFRNVTRHEVLTDPSVLSVRVDELESLEEINHRLKGCGIRMHLSEVKSPVMDRLQGTRLLDVLTGKIFQSQFDAIKKISPGVFCREDDSSSGMAQLRNRHCIPLLPWR